MKKIMFNDRYGLTQAVLDGHKTMTRRIIPQDVVDYYENEAEDPTLIDAAKFWVGDEVAIAQSYRTIHEEMMNGDYGNSMYDAFRGVLVTSKAGWNNKMFVRAKLMPHLIRITDVDVQRLQSISDEDCLKEGVVRREIRPFREIEIKYQVPRTVIYKDNPKDAFAALIDKVSGKGTWEKNPWVFAYTFELIR